MKVKELEKVINERLVGQEFNAWSNGYQALHVIEDYCPEIKGQFSIESDHQTVNIYRYTTAYTKYALLSLDIKKKRGTYHKYGYYDWNVSKIILNSLYDDREIKDAVNDIIEKERRDKEAKNDKIDRLSEVFTLLSTTYNLSEYETELLIRDLRENLYSVSTRAKVDKKGLQAN